jgi:hypothetical protein
MVILVRNAPSVSGPQYVYAGSRVVISSAVLYEPPLQHHRWIPGEIPPAVAFCTAPIKIRSSLSLPRTPNPSALEKPPNLSTETNEICRSRDPIVRSELISLIDRHQGVGVVHGRPPLAVILLQVVDIVSLVL